MESVFVIQVFDYQTYTDGNPDQDSKYFNQFGLWEYKIRFVHKMNRNMRTIISEWIQRRFYSNIVKISAQIIKKCRKRDYK